MYGIVKVEMRDAISTVLWVSKHTFLRERKGHNGPKKWTNLRHNTTPAKAFCMSHMMSNGGDGYLAITCGACEDDDEDDLNRTATEVQDYRCFKNYLEWEKDRFQQRETHKWQWPLQCVRVSFPDLHIRVVFEVPTLQDTDHHIPRNPITSMRVPV